MTSVIELVDFFPQIASVALDLWDITWNEENRTGRAEGGRAGRQSCHVIISKHLNINLYLDRV